MSQAFLEIEQSFTGRRWTARTYDERVALALTQRHGLADIIAKSLSARGIGLEDAEAFLEPKLRDLLPDPSHLKDMDKAVARFIKALENHEPIAIYGDYDVDGATSSALLIRFGRSLGCVFDLYIPDRLSEGYGPNAKAMELLGRQGIKLIICVDCGTTAHAPLKAAHALGIDVIVLDHHTSEINLPTAVALVNPNRIDETGDYGYLAAVGVTYLFVIAANRALRLSGYFNNTRKEPDLLRWLDLVALGTVCDVVKLVGLNRGFVAQGLRIAAQKGNPGIAALAEIAGAKAIDAYAAGFLLGPRVNAGGRVGEAALGAKILSTDDVNVALSSAQHLQALNNERREIEARVLVEAERLTLEEKLPMAFVASENWHPGVIGIVASRLKDKFRHPAIVIALENDVGKGSGRSIGNIDLGAHILAAHQAGLLINGGGHKMAAGFTVSRDNVDRLRDFLAERIGRQMEAEPLIPTLTLDGVVSGTSLHPNFVRQIEALGPFGTGNSEPRFVLVDCSVIRADIVGEKHVSVIVSHSGQRVRGIAFRAMESDLGQALLTNRRLHLAGHLRIDEWQGQERVQLHISDAAMP